MKSWSCLASKWPVVLLPLVAPFPASTPLFAFGLPSQAASQVSYQAASWAMGVVVPEGAQLAGGRELRWENVANVTVALRLPNLDRPDLPTYAVLSIMTQDGSVLQVAAGIYRGGRHWFTYADMVTKADSMHPEYQQILNSSGPEMSPRDSVVLSIFRATGLWNLNVRDATSGSSVAQPLPSGVASSPKAGDQETFALESYSRNQTTFQGMGDLVLTALEIDGRSVSKGLYPYSDWYPGHNPVFVVGSSGTSPPAFILLHSGANGSLVWSYQDQWGSGDSAYPLSYSWVPLSLLLLGSLAVVASVIVWLRRLRVRSSRAPLGNHVAGSEPARTGIFVNREERSARPHPAYIGASPMTGDAAHRAGRIV